MYDAQVAAITRVQRLPPSWNQISFYRIKRGKVDWSDVALFPCTDEFRLAQIRFTIQNKSYRATLICVAGHIFDLTLVPSPKPVMFSNWDAPPSVRILADPLRATTGRKPLENLPAEWQMILERHGGQSHSGWLLYDQDTAYRVALADGEFVIVGEKEGVEYLLYRVEPRTDQLYYLEHYDGTPEPLRGGIEALLEAHGKPPAALDRS